MQSNVKFCTCSKFCGFQLLHINLISTCIYMYVYIFWPLSAGAAEADPALGFGGVLFPREISVDDVSLKSSPSLFAG